MGIFSASLQTKLKAVSFAYQVSRLWPPIFGNKRAELFFEADKGLRARRRCESAVGKEIRCVFCAEKFPRIRTI